MAKEVIMPKFGFTQEESQIVEWLVKEGDTVDAGDPLLEVTTDKVNMEVEAPAAGIVAGISAAAGDVVPVTQVIAYILAPGEALPANGPRPAAPAAQAPAPPATAAPAPPATQAPEPAHTAATPIAARVAAASGVDTNQVAGTGPGGRVTRKDVEGFLAAQPAAHPAVDGAVRATPAARRLARETGADLAAIAGSGPRQRVQADDVRAAAATSAAPQPTTPPVAPLPAGEPRREPFSTMRRTIARNMQRSMQEAPHITFQADIDMTAIQALVSRANERRPAGSDKVTLTAALARAVAWALERNPALNSHLGQDELLLWPAAHIGIAVALDDGLIVPVVKDVGAKGVGRLSNEIRDLSQRAKTGKLRPEELADATFTISNLGMFGVDRFTAIINPPQVAILAVGRTRRVFVPGEDDAPVVRPICTMTLSADHRAIDGAIAARFIGDLREVVENPELMVI
jgi:pyruvate dehydrogenase E2 component (dihydrolipoamide acetyltransferase)